MLRFIAPFLARLLILIVGVGLLVSRAWGWNEYASSELYTPDKWRACFAQSGLFPMDS